MTAGDSDLFRVDGSKVWMSPTAVAYAREYFGDGHQGVRKMAEYLRLRHQMQTAALTSPTAPMSDFSSYLDAPSGIPQEYEATAGEPQTEPPPLDPEAVPYLPNVAPID
jgi:hypothetical protein